MTLQQLRDFLAIIEHGSLRGAARSRAVSQAGLTRSLQKLEAELGLSLLVRSTQGVSLTAYGEHLLGYAQQILASCERVTEDLRQMQGLEGGTLRLGISPSPSIELLPVVLPEFRRLYPGVMIELVHGLGQQLLTALREQRIELAVTPLSQRADADDLASTPLYPTDPCLICRSGHPLAQATEVEQLKEAQWVLTAPPTDPEAPGGTIIGVFERLGLGAPRVAIVSNSFFDTLHLVRHSDLLTHQSGAAFASPAFSAGLSRIPIDLAALDAGHTVSLLHRRHPGLSPAAATFARMLISYARLRERAAERSHGRAAGGLPLRVGSPASDADEH